MPPSEIGSRLSAYEFNYLHLAETLEPYGEKRADYRAIFIAWIIACVNCKNPPSIKKMSDMFHRPFEIGIEDTQTDEAIKVIFNQMVETT